MANDFLLYKWKLWFKALGPKDGFLTRQGVSEEEDKFAHLHHLGEQKKKDVVSKLDEWWDEFIFRRKPGPISEEEYVAMQNTDYKTDRGKYKVWAEACAKKIFDILDINHDGMINEEEFLVAFRSAGHENVQLDKDFFSSYEPVDGKVPVKKMVDTWVLFLTSEDSSQKDIIKIAFEAGV